MTYLGDEDDFEVLLISSRVFEKAMGDGQATQRAAKNNDRLSFRHGDE